MVINIKRPRHPLMQVARHTRVCMCESVSIPLYTVYGIATRLQERRIMARNAGRSLPFDESHSSSSTHTHERESARNVGSRAHVCSFHCASIYHREAVGRRCCSISNTGMCRCGGSAEDRLTRYTLQGGKARILALLYSAAVYWRIV